MKRFRFRLEQLLELRAFRERQALARLAEATGHCVRLARGIRETDEARGEAFRTRYLSAGALDLALLGYRERYLGWLAAHRRRLVEELEARQRQRREEQAKYLEVSKERKVLDKLKERRAAEYYRKARNEEFKATDDTSSGQFIRDAREREGE